MPNQANIISNHKNSHKANYNNNKNSLHKLNPLLTPDKYELTKLYLKFYFQRVQHIQKILFRSLMHRNLI